MDENIFQKVGKVAIKADDSLCVPLDDEDIRVGIRECTSSVILCMFDEVDVNLTGLKMVLQKTWNCDNISFQQLDDHKFQAFFRQRRLYNSRWIMDLGVLKILLYWFVNGRRRLLQEGRFSRWSDYGYMLLAFLGTVIRLRWARNYPNCFPNVSN